MVIQLSMGLLFLAAPLSMALSFEEQLLSLDSMLDAIDANAPPRAPGGCVKTTYASCTKASECKSDPKDPCTGTCGLCKKEQFVNRCKCIQATTAAAAAPGAPATPGAAAPSGPVPPKSTVVVPIRELEGMPGSGNLLRESRLQVGSMYGGGGLSNNLANVADIKAGQTFGSKHFPQMDGLSSFDPTVEKDIDSQLSAASKMPDTTFTRPTSDKLAGTSKGGDVGATAPAPATAPYLTPSSNPR